MAEKYAHRKGKDMKRTIASLITIIALALPALASAATWNIDQDHTNVGFKVGHMMVSNVKGSFLKFSGTVELNDQDITKSKVAVTIDTASINTNVQKRDEQLVPEADGKDNRRYNWLSR
jgi:polyisoprenoid-binding protein YceI